jgi:hypothetical protein
VVFKKKERLDFYRILSTKKIFKMKTKAQKRTEAKNNAEAVKAQKKAARTSKMSVSMPQAGSKKGKSMVPQAKKKK